MLLANQTISVAYNRFCNLLLIISFVNTGPCLFETSFLLTLCSLSLSTLYLKYFLKYCRHLCLSFLQYVYINIQFRVWFQLNLKSKESYNSLYKLLKWRHLNDYKQIWHYWKQVLWNLLQRGHASCKFKIDADLISRLYMYVQTSRECINCSFFLAYALAVFYSYLLW